MNRGVMAVAIVALLAGGGAAWRALRVEHANSPTPAERQTVALKLSAIGTAQPIASVGIKSHIDAQIAEVKVEDGQYVKAGDVLFLLDSRAAKAQVLQAEAQLARDKAQLVNANRHVGRYAPLVKKDFVSHQQYDTAVTTAQALEASVRADGAAMQNAEVRLTCYAITAPIDGRLGMVTAKAAEGPGAAARRRGAGHLHGARHSL